MTDGLLYFFGVGAQKAGTTWLHDLLETYPDCAVPPVKELHYFDIKYISEKGTKTHSIYRHRVSQLAQMASGFERDVRKYWESASLDQQDRRQKPDIYQNGYLDNVNVQKRLSNIAKFARYLQIQDIETYKQYLVELAQNKGAGSIGEITPAYSMLPESAFREMDQHFPGCKFIYIMRDPVDRFLSQLRFRRKLLKKKGTDEDPVSYFDQAVEDPGYLQRSDYSRLMDVLESVIPAERIHYEFFERMLSPDSVVESVRSIERFLQLRPKDEGELLSFVKVKKNVSEAADFSEAQISRVRSLLSGVYDSVESRFGFLPEDWMKP